jgi:peptidoglycan/LPS O-acetylase OafA/YrhL
MNQYKIFEHPSGAIEAVKQGWSWPAFSFGFIWAMVKKMWQLSIGVVLAFIAIGFTIGVTGSVQWGDAIVNGIGVTANLIFGVHGNGWREKNLLSRGYQQKQAVTAPNPKSAVALYLKGAAAG